MIKTLKKLTLITTVAILSLGTAFAGTPTKSVDNCKNNCNSCSLHDLALSGTLNVDYLNNFTFRGTVLDTNPVLRPGLSLSLPLPLGGSLFDSTSLELSVAQALASKGSTGRWSRTDASVGVAAVKGDLKVTTSYQVVTSPNNSFNTADGVSVRLDYDDSGSNSFLPTLNPHVEAYFGLNNNPGNNTKNGSAVGNYYEVGIEPSTKVSGVKVSVPVNVGFGAGNYYTGNKSYGYTSAGVKLSKEIAANTDLYGGVTYLNSGDGVNANKNNWLTSVGLRYSF